MGSEVIIAVQQYVEELPYGYVTEHYEALSKLADCFEILPEWALSILNDETTAGMDADDEYGVSAAFLAPQFGMPGCVKISAPELSEPERRADFVDQVDTEFREILAELPDLGLLYQFPPDA